MLEGNLERKELLSESKWALYGSSANDRVFSSPLAPIYPRLAILIGDEQLFTVKNKALFLFGLDLFHFYCVVVPIDDLSVPYEEYPDAMPGLD